MLRKSAAFLLVLTVCSFGFAQDQRVQQAIDKGLTFLKAQQQADGSWQKAQDPPGITALVLRAFVLDPKYNADTDFVKRGYDKLLTFQVGDGGIYTSELTAYNTAISLSALAAADRDRFKEPMDKALKYLRGFQWTETLVSPKGKKITSDKDPWYGGWGYEGGNGRPDLSNTQVVLDALHDAGIKPDDPAYKNAIKFLSRMQNNSETNDQPWAGNDGGFIYSPGDNNNGDSKAGEYTGPDGKRMLRSYGSMTYAGFKSLIYAGLTKDDPRVKAAWDWITKDWTLEENPGLRLGNPQMAKYGLYYYFHAMARALDAFDQPTITDPQGKVHDWRIELVEKLTALQKPDGSWSGESRWMEANPILATAYCVQALEDIQRDLKEHPAK